MKKRFYAIFLALILFSNMLPKKIIYAQNTVQSVLSQDIVSKRKSDLDILIKTLKEKHPNIYNKNDNSVFNNKINKITQNLDKISDFEFAIQLSELASLVNDSHTKISLNSFYDNLLFLPFEKTQVKEGIMITKIDKKNENVLGGIITSINGIDINEIKNRLKPMISYDNEVYLNTNFLSYFYIYDILKYYNIVNSPKDITIDVKIDDKIETIKVDALNNKQLSETEFVTLNLKDNITSFNSDKIYFYKKLNDDVLYIQYNSCREDKNLSMKTFTNQIKQEIENNNYKKIILDIRYNSGGSDGIIIPLMNLLEQKLNDGINVYTLIGGKTFSSALINAVMMKDIGSIIVGENTGGCVDHFGEVSFFELPNSKIDVSYSNKFFELDTLLHSAKPYGIESFRPDIYAIQTRKDYLNSIDTAVDVVLKDTTKPNFKTNLTREDLAFNIGSILEKKANDGLIDLIPIQTLNSNFEDIKRVSYTTPYIILVDKNSIMVGKTKKQFSPKNEVTRGELAVVLLRYAKLCNIPLNNLQKQNEKILDINTVKPWQKEAVEILGTTNIFTLENGNFNANKIVSLEEFNNVMNNFLKLQ